MLINLLKVPISSFSAMTMLMGSLTRKIVPEMTYSVSSGTLNPTKSYPAMVREVEKWSEIRVRITTKS